MTQLLEREGPSINTPQEDGLCCVFQDRAQAAAVYSQKIGPRLEQAGPALVFQKLFSENIAKQVLGFVLCFSLTSNFKDQIDNRYKFDKYELMRNKNYKLMRTKAQN